MQTKLARIAEIAKGNPKEQFTSLYHLLNEELLTQCHRELDGNKATGVDQVTKAADEMNALIMSCKAQSVIVRCFLRYF